MARRLPKPGRNTWLMCGSLLWLAGIVTVRAGTMADVSTGEDLSIVRSIPQTSSQAPLRQAPAPQSVAPAVAQTLDSAKAPAYMGDANCLGCHDSQRAGYERTLHHQKIDPRTPAANQGCETCHGPGSLHADDPDNVGTVRNFKVMAPGAINDTCTTCHNRGEHALWDGSPHERRDLSCTSCHSIHKAMSDGGALRAKTETDVCASCHRDKAAKLDRSGHMPLREGKMACSTCHNMHGSTNVSLLRKGDSIAEMCTSCHADKRGPYVWEHAPSRDGCVTCHDPHGSSNERMLVVKTPMLCQRCHVATRHPSTIYDQALINTSVRVYARSCVTCHTNMHGSNHPSGKFFIR